MDYNQLAKDIIAELKNCKVECGRGSHSDAQIAEILGISRQAYLRRRDDNALTTEDITRLSAHLITAHGGGFYLNKYFGLSHKEGEKHE